LTEYIENLKSSQERLEKNIITSYEINKSLIDDIKNSVKIPDKKMMYFDIEKILNEKKCRRITGGFMKWRQ